MLARVVGGQRRWLEVNAVADLGFGAGNLVVDYGLRRGLRALPHEMGLWPIRRRRLSPQSWFGFAATFVVMFWLIDRLNGLLVRASKGSSGRLLNWTPLNAGWHPPERLTRRRLAYTIPLAVVSEETYIRGVLWSRMAWLGRWRPLVNGTAWACYHLNRPVKDMVGSILPGALLASYVREQTGNIYWTAVGHYASNAYAAWRRGRKQCEDSTALDRVD
jgi:membrane protease YdiL (CAAX protease family)